MCGCGSGGVCLVCVCGGVWGIPASCCHACKVGIRRAAILVDALVLLSGPASAELRSIVRRGSSGKKKYCFLLARRLATGGCLSYSSDADSPLTREINSPPPAHQSFVAPRG
jgi:hypothetical protein